MKATVSFLMLFSCLTLSAQDFFRENFDRNYHYVLLANPTKANIQTIRFLTEKKLLKINPEKVHFVGIYHEGQAYDFEQAAGYIKDEGLNNFFLHEFRQPVEENQLFGLNKLSEEFKLIFENSVGIFFFGGPDIQPSMYGEENTLSVVTDPERHKLEASLMFHLLGGYQNETFTPFLNENPEYLVTGFCLGMQTMNVATGGTLIQDIPLEIYGTSTPEETLKTGKENLHRNYWNSLSNDQHLMGINFHTIRFTENPFFVKKVKPGRKTTPLVYSSHHQAVEKPGKDLEITATSADGKIVEALAHSQFPHVFSVQFHPEVPALYENREAYKFTPDDVPQTYHRIIGRENVRFHKKYWKYISKSLEKDSR